MDRPDPSLRLLMISTLNLSKQNGGSVHFTSIAKGFRRRGFAVDAILPTTGDDAADATIAARFDHVTWSSTWLSRLVRFSRTSINSLTQVRAARRADPAQYDWVYLRATPLSLFVLLALRRRGFERIFVEHNGWFADELVMMGVPRVFKGLLARLQTSEARRATRLRVVAPGILDKLRTHTRDVDDLDARTVVIGNGADLDHYRPIDRAAALTELGLDPERFYLGFIGDLDPWQGVDNAIDAMPAIRARHPNAEILVVGAGRRLGDLKQSYGDRPYVHFFGSTPYAKTNTVINAFDIALLPKRGLATVGYSPIKLFTYAAAGRAILASRIRGIDRFDETRGDEAGFVALHEPADAADLARAACTLIDDDERRTRNAEKARTYAEAHFSWQLAADRIAAAMGAAPGDGAGEGTNAARDPDSVRSSAGVGVS